jgi:hypothetical protein
VFLTPVSLLFSSILFPAYLYHISRHHTYALKNTTISRLSGYRTLSMDQPLDLGAVVRHPTIGGLFKVMIGTILGK